MKKQLISITITFLILLIFSKNGMSQAVYAGFTTGFTNVQINLPGTDNSTSTKPGFNFGFYLRFGKRPFYQGGIDFIRSRNNIKTGAGNLENTPLHQFDFSLKVGYEILQKPLFKWNILGGPFIGKALMMSTANLDFKNSDFVNPQFGLIAGTGIQITNFIINVEYAYHISRFFNPSETKPFLSPESHIERLSLKFGVQF